MHRPFQPIKQVPPALLWSFQCVKAQKLELIALVKCSPVQIWKDSLIFVDLQRNDSSIPSLL